MPYGVAIIGHEIIDEINILQATKLAMKQAVEKLIMRPDILGNAIEEPLIIKLRDCHIKSTVKSISPHRNL